MLSRLISSFLVIAALAAAASAQADSQSNRANEIVTKAIQNLGGDRYLKVNSQIGKGKFSIIRENVVISFQSFTDIIVFPDKERTEFKGNGSRMTQVNTGDTGWVYDGDQSLIKTQTPDQIAGFRRGIRTSLDNLLRGYWKGDAELSYVGRRAATLGKRNDVLRLKYKDGFVVEFEFSTEDGIPAKSIFTRTSADGEDIKEEDRYAQFVETGGVKSPYIVDRFVNGKASSRINYESLEFNKKISDTIFSRPTNPKEAKKEVKY
ncbi:MAG: hypothetical protein WKF34_06365 [Pyrinomonadaceae bacterium]